MYAPPKRAVFTGTKPECVLESMASQSTLPSRIEELNDAHVALFALGGAYMAVFAMCAFGWPSWLAHIARNAMYAPPKRAVFTGTKPEWVLESMASQSKI